jgi:ribonuclease J
MKDNQKELSLDPAALFFIPLGGSEEFGVNFNLYAHAGKFLAVDCGLGFADHRFPGVDILLPDAGFIADRYKNLAGLVITHAHEDHIGAVSYLWPSLKCPIYCTRFTASVLKRKLSEAPACSGAKITIVDTGDAVDIGPFKVHFIHVAHSIPDTAALVIETKAGKVLHSGDWNLDPHPVLNPPTDEESFRKFGNAGIMAYVGDSTNAEVPGRAGSETEVEAGLTALFGECKGRIAITMFASNISRVHSIAKAAKANKRHVALVGRSLHTMTGAAFDCGYLDDIPPFLDKEDIDRLPANQIVMCVTGSQGEVRAALARIARGENRDISLGRGDTVIFSSRAIPGNETEINEVRNNLVAGGVTVITAYDTEHKIHVSGHPCRDEIGDMYQWVRPKLVVPVHGQRTQLEAQAAFARQCQIENVIVPNNGSVIRLGPGAPAVIDHIPTGLLAVEPNRIIASDHLAIAERRKLQFTGVVHVTVVLDEHGRLVSAPQVSTMGLIDPEKPEEMRMIRGITGEIEDILADMHDKDLQDDHAVHEEIRIGVRRLTVMLLGIKPKATVHVVRI